VNRAFALTIGLLAALAPAMARAQTNIDQGKSASQIFSNACVECHKSAGGLGKGKNASAVAEFLREHYTTSRDQAAALAAYVVRGRDTVAAPAPGRKPPAEHASASTVNAKPRRPGEADAKPKDEASPSGLSSFMNPIARPEPNQRENRPALATRNRRKEPVTPEPPQEPAAVAHAPAAVVAGPAHPEMPVQEANPAAAPAPTAAAPMEVPTGETGEPVPRDDIPD
jgi:mono/diheme cytochrome c family protein